MKIAALTIAALLTSVSSQAEGRDAATAQSTPIAAPMCQDIDHSSDEAQHASRERLLVPDQPFVMDALVRSVAAARKAAFPPPRDWPGFCRYAAANRSAKRSAIRPRVILIGDSITDNWQQADPNFFGELVLDRGIAGQTSSQTLLRMYPDVVSLNPQAVQIMVGTNDIAENDGPIDDDLIVGNINAMIDIAQVNGIRVILASIPPAAIMFWNPEVRPVKRIVQLNERLHALAIRRHVIWIDYHAALTDRAGGLPTTVSNDGVHPTRRGYAAMRPLLERALHFSRPHERRG